MTYNEIIQKAGKKVKKHVYYIINNVTTNVNDNNVERVKFDTQTPLIGTSINGCEITLKEPINGNIYVQIEAKYKNETKTETFGPFTLKEEPTYDANKKTYLHKCYDNMLKSMIDYQAITMTYPCTIYQFFSRLVYELGYTNNIANLPNGNIQMPSDIYTGINYTYRDVLDDIAIANGVLFYIDGNEIKIATLGGDAITINDDILKNKNIEFGEHYGPINSIVLSRSAGTDNVYIQDEESIVQYGLHEFKISDNQLMNDNNRDLFLANLLIQLDGIEYDIYDTELTGYGKLRPLQSINFETGNNTYSSYIFNNEITLTAGYKQAIYNEPPIQTETNYKSADTTDKRINQTQLIVDKQQGIIDSLVSNTTYVSDTKTGVGSIQLENAYEGQLYKLSIKGNISLLFPQSNVQYGYPLVPHNNLTPSNTLTPSSPVPYENEIHYPSSQLFSKSSNLIIDETEYELDLDFLNYMSETIYDEFIYDNGTCYIIRRVGINSEGNMYALASEVIEPRESVVLNVKSNSTISLKSFPSAILSATYLLDNIYTDNFATEVYVQSQIEQTADSITSTVSANYETKENANYQYSQIQQTTNSITEEVNQKVGDNEVVAKLNLAIQDGQGVINLTGDQVTIDSTNFKLDAQGNIKATDAELRNANIINGAIYLKQETGSITLPIILEQTSSNNVTYRSTFGSGGIYLRNQTDNKVYARLSGGSLGYGLFELHDSSGTTRIEGNGNVGSVIIKNSSSDNIIEMAHSNQRGLIRLYDSSGNMPIVLTAQSGNIKCVSLTQTSREESKKNFEKYNNALEIIKNIDIYKYNMKNETNNDKKHIGFVIGDKYKYSQEITSQENDGVDLYSFISVCCKAIQEQQEIIEGITQRIEALERESDK